MCRHSNSTSQCIIRWSLHFHHRMSAKGAMKRTGRHFKWSSWNGKVGSYIQNSTCRWMNIKYNLRSPPQLLLVSQNEDFLVQLRSEWFGIVVKFRFTGFTQTPSPYFSSKKNAILIFFFSLFFFNYWNFKWFSFFFTALVWSCVVWHINLLFSFIIRGSCSLGV